MEIGGRPLPAGVSITPSIYLMHRREDIYPEPFRFLPERFLERPAGTYTWIPFGGGVRRCLGASFALFEMKTVLATLVTRLQLRPADERSEAGGPARDHARPRARRRGGGRLMPRLSRKEKQAKTRSSLMKSAAKVFCRQGMDRASIDQVAEDAGYTKGAFYANFKNKEELFLAMLDEHFAEHIEEVERAFADTEEPPPEQARHAAADFVRSLHADPERSRLFHEFIAYGMRDEEFRQELLTRFATLRDRFERVYQRRADEVGLTLDIPMERIVRMVLAMADGFALWQRLEPDAMDDQLFEDMMELFTIGVGVRGGILEQTA